MKWLYATALLFAAVMVVGAVLVAVKIVRQPPTPEREQFDHAWRGLMDAGGSR